MFKYIEVSKAVAWVYFVF